MYAARQRHQKRASFIVAQKAARLARLAERRARTAEPSAGLMAVRSQPHTKHRTYDGRKATPLEESARGQRGGWGRGELLGVGCLGQWQGRTQLHMPGEAGVYRGGLRGWILTRIATGDDHVCVCRGC